MFEARASAKTFTTLFKAVYAVTEQAIFELAPNSIKITAMNPPRTALVNLAIHAESPQFGNGEYRFAANVWEILKVLRGLEKESEVSIRYDGGSELKINSAAVEVLEPESLFIPKLTYSAKIIANANTLLSVVEFFNAHSVFTMKIAANRGEIIFSAVNDDVCIQVKFNSNMIISVETAEEVKAYYDIILLYDVMKAVEKLTSLVYLEFSTDYPMRISTPICFTEYSPARGFIEYLIAPRIFET